MKKTITLVALMALLAGCSGGGSGVVSKLPGATAGTVKTPQSGGPGTTTLTYYTQYAPVGQCSTGVLTLMVGGSYPATHLNFAAGNGPPLVVSNCHFSTPQYVKVQLGTPDYGSPYISQTAYNVTIDAAAAAQVTATWTALGPTLPGTPGLTGTVSFTIGDPDGGGGL
jgi:hypothetical protein